jgi:hypothetical protein
MGKRRYKEMIMIILLTLTCWLLIVCVASIMLASSLDVPHPDDEDDVED